MQEETAPTSNERLVKLLGADNAYTGSIAYDAEGNIYVVGNTSDSSFDGKSNHGSYDIIVVKYDKIGNRIWSKMIGTTKYDIVSDMIVTSNKIIIGGRTEDYISSNSNNDGYLVALDFQGNELWSKALGVGEEHQDIRKITFDDNGNIYATGSYTILVNEKYSQSTYITKLNSEGITIWDKQVEFEFVRDIQVDNNENIYITGTTGNGAYNLFLLKLNSSGSTQWIKTMGDTRNGANGLSVKLIDDLIYVVGFAHGVDNIFDGYSIPDRGNHFVVQYDTDGNKIKSCLLEDSSSGINYAKFGNDNNIYIVRVEGLNLFEGYSTLGGSDVFIIKYDLDGKKLSAKQFGGSGYDRVNYYDNGISISSDGVVYLTGETQGDKFEGLTSNATNSDLFMIRYSEK